VGASSRQINIAAGLPESTPGARNVGALFPPDAVERTHRRWDAARPGRLAVALTCLSDLAQPARPRRVEAERERQLDRHQLPEDERDDRRERLFQGRLE
jgi:hypothetical protein